MSAILGFLANAWVQLIMWIPAAVLIYLFRNYMKGLNDTWTWVAAGVLIYGVRIGYKLMPFYKASTVTEAGRYALGIIGLTVLFIGFLKYYYNNAKPLVEMM